MKNKSFLFSYLFILLLLAVAGLHLFSPSASSLQTGSSNLERIIFDDSIPYLYLDDPATAIVGEEGIVVSSHQSTVTVYTNQLEYVFEFSTANTVLRLAIFLDTVLTLQDGKILLDSTTSHRTLSGQYDSFFLDKSTYTLFALANDTLFAFDIINLLKSELPTIDESIYLQKTYTFSFAQNGGVSAFASSPEYVYFAQASHNNKNYSDIFCINRDTAKIEKMYERASKISYMAYYADNIYTLTDNELIKYSIFDEKLSKEASISAYGLSLDVYLGKLYMLTYENSLLCFNKDLMQQSTVFQSESSDLGFFSAPAYAYTRRNHIYVADTLNNRLFAANSSEKIAVSGFDRISSVVSNNLGEVYISYGINKIAKLDKQLQLIETMTLSRSIKKLLVDIDNNIYAISNTKLFLLSLGQLVELDKFPCVIDACFAIGSNALIVYDGSLVYKNLLPLDNSSKNTSLFSQSNIIGLAADINHNVFFFDNEANLYRFDSMSKMFRLLSDADMSKIIDNTSSIYISSIQNEYLKIGDLILTNPSRHSIFRFDGGTAEVEVLDDSHISPDINEKNHTLSDDPIIYRLKHDAELYPAPIEVGGKQLKAGDRIIYYYDYNSLEEYAFVMYEDSKAQKLLSGYVFRNLIDFSHYQYSLPANDNAVVYFDNTPIYKWPSVHSAILAHYDKETVVTLKTFSAPLIDSLEYSIGSYSDSYSKLWYRIEFEDGSDAYVRADNLSVNQYDPQLRPKTNAQIKEYDGLKYAYLYYYSPEKDTYYLIKDELPLPVGTRIELVNVPLDPQKEYNEIRFYREGLGTLTCYVKTNYIQYDTVNTLQIVAIAALVIVLTSAIVLVAYFVKHKRKTLEETKD